MSRHFSAYRICKYTGIATQLHELNLKRSTDLSFGKLTRHSTISWPRLSLQSELSIIFISWLGLQAGGNLKEAKGLDYNCLKWTPQMGASRLTRWLIGSGKMFGTMSNGINYRTTSFMTRDISQWVISIPLRRWKCRRGSEQGGSKERTGQNVESITITPLNQWRGWPREQSAFERRTNGNVQHKRELPVLELLKSPKNPLVLLSWTALKLFCWKPTARCARIVATLSRLSTRLQRS
mmetsp:Transcript_37925/g.59168  ORF Transcript_37925/g.59168 Transcript_37925/m.59168 type:complete len:237 (+) Transcript_37925:122-832(+)